MKKQPPESFDYESAKQKVKEQLRTGKSLFGKEGAFAPLLQEMLNSILEGEIEGHLDGKPPSNSHHQASGHQSMIVQ